VGDLMEEKRTSAGGRGRDQLLGGFDGRRGLGRDGWPISNFRGERRDGESPAEHQRVEWPQRRGPPGKSTGEFVGNVFDGKGGRPTPTRLTSEAFQKGRSGQQLEPPWRRTGGRQGRRSSGEGLEGPAPPDIQMKMKGMALKSAASQQGRGRSP